MQAECITTECALTNTGSAIQSCDCTSNINIKQKSKAEFYFELKDVEGIQRI